MIMINPTMFLLFQCAPGYDRYLSVFLIVLFFLSLSVFLPTLHSKDRYGKIYAGVLAVFCAVCTFFVCDLLLVWTFFPARVYTDFGFWGDFFRLLLCTLVPLTVIFTGCKIAVFVHFRKKRVPWSKGDETSSPP